MAMQINTIGYNLKELKHDKGFRAAYKRIEIKSTDMLEDLKVKCAEKISSAIEKYIPDIEGAESQPDLAAQSIKESMEKENGPVWICIIGESFSFNVKAQKEAYLYCYCGDYGILLYKC